ncbi:hypothetical protein AB4144_66500, partial [Rhizobiaceae sp. 2RAB30]
MQCCIDCLRRKLFGRQTRMLAKRRHACANDMYVRHMLSFAERGTPGKRPLLVTCARHAQSR